ncbi:hypothetical protein SFRURICE_017106 [Spodoptera frugiperda]|nr:hypothetical protein SFRURICE_017106 [Spodoptera frugiperda]
MIDTCNVDKNFNRASVASVTIYCWMIKDFMWQTTLSYQCEKLYIAIQSVQDTCTSILRSNCSENERKSYKNVLRLHRASFSKIRVCGLFYVDVGLQLTMMNLLTNYIVVILQFAYL